MNHVLKRIAKAVCQIIRFSRRMISYATVGSTRPFLLLDTPEHGNIGDQAIALAERQLLDDWFGHDSYFEVSANQMDGFEKVLARFSPAKQVVLVQGGGFLGMLWPNEEHRFRRIIEAFRDHRIVVFPQTVTFDRSTSDGEAFLRESVSSWCAHSDLTICCRERQSECFVSENFPGVRALLTPDIVLGLKLPDMQAERRDAIFCFRADCEQSLDEVGAEGLCAAVGKALPGDSIVHTDTVIDRRVPSAGCEQEVFAKLSEFSRARLVVTDRLHGMVFAAITGTPCIALNNSNGKVGRVYEWISELPYVQFCESVDEAVAAIRDGIPEPGRFPFSKYYEMLVIIRDLLRKECCQGTNTAGDAGK